MRKFNTLMKASVLLKSAVLTSLFAVSSCATTTYSENIQGNDYTNLEAGKTYVLTMRDGSKKQKLLFRNIKGDTIIGMAGKKDSAEIKIAKSNIVSAKDTRKATLSTAGVVIGAAGVAAIVVSSMRAD